MDNNALLDYLLDRQPTSAQARLLLLPVANARIRLSAASLSLVTMHYVVRRSPSQNNESAVAGLRDLRRYVQPLPVAQVTVDAAFASGASDFEDAVQYFTTTADATVEAIITGDRTYFQHSPLPVYPPEQALQLLLNA